MGLGIFHRIPQILIPFHRKSRSPLDGQGMYRQIVRPHLFHLLQRMGHVLDSLSGQSHNQIHVDMGKPFLPGHGIALPDLFRRMFSPDNVKGSLVHGLGIDGNPIHPVPANSPQLVSGYAVRPPRLHGKFQHMLHGNVMLNHGNQPVQPHCREGCGRPAADIDGVALFPRKALRQESQFLLQGVQVGIHFFLPLICRIAGKRTIEASAGAEGDPHIEAVTVLIVQTLQKRLLPFGNGDRQIRLLIGAQVRLVHEISDLFLPSALLQKVQGNLCGADSCQRPPGQCPFRPFRQHMVEDPLDAILRIPLIGKIDGSPLRYHFLSRILFIRILSRAPRPRIQRHGNFLRRKVHNKTKRYFSLRLLRKVRDRVDFLFRIKGFDQGINIVFVISFL